MSTIPSGDGEALCYLCLDAGSEPLRRTDSGFVHLSCLTNYAASKSKQALGMIEFVDPWRLCPNCHQEYQNELAVDVATKFVSFVRVTYPRDTRMQVEALYLKLRALDSMLGRLQPVQKREVGVTADVILSLIERMNGGASPLSMRYSQVKALTTGVLGRLAVKEGTDESARRAVVHFENQLEVNKAIGNFEGIVTAKSNIALARSMYVGGVNHEELIKASQELYELHVVEFGQENGYSIDAGKTLAIQLQDANRGEEARELLVKLLAISRQVLGPHHKKTIQLMNKLK